MEIAYTIYDGLISETFLPYKDSSNKLFIPLVMGMCSTCLFIKLDSRN